MTFADEAERLGRELVAATQAEQAAPRKPRDRYRQQVEGRFHMASQTGKATVWIDRAGTVSVRPYRKWRVYRMPIADLASLMVRTQIAAETRAAKPRKARIRRGRIR